jgi:hypothetical protein
MDKDQFITPFPNSMTPHDEKRMVALAYKKEKLQMKLASAVMEFVVKKFENETGFRATGNDVDFSISAGGIGERAWEMIEEFIDNDLTEEIEQMLASDHEDEKKEKTKPLPESIMNCLD